MKSKALLIEIIGLLDDFELSRTKDETINLPDFVSFLNARQDPAQLDIRLITGDLEQEMIRDETTSDVEITRLISVMYRYAKTYIKKALMNSPIQTVDEFSFIIILMTYDSLSKTELIQKNIMEKTSGSSIINRLISKGLIRQFGHESDKRSQLVSVTDEGRAEIFRVLPNMNKVSHIVSGNLSESEKNTMAYLLKKLDYHHNELYMNQREATLDDLVQQT